MRRVHVVSKSKISGFPIVEVTGHNRWNFNDYSVSSLKLSQENSSPSVNKSSPRDNQPQGIIASNSSKQSKKESSVWQCH